MSSAAAIASTLTGIRNRTQRTLVPTLLHVLVFPPQVKAAIEEHRLRLGYGVHQVLFNIDLHSRGNFGDVPEGVRRRRWIIGGI